MACFHPIAAWQRHPGVPLSFSGGSLDGKPLIPDLYIGCGQCRGCRLERSRRWACRIMHEASCWPANVFVTLTYDDECIPYRNSLVYRDFQLFMKRMRKAYAPREIRHFTAGEYGGMTGRPHFHSCLFNMYFHDRKIWSNGKFPLYFSPTLDKLWGKGRCLFGNLSFESAAYTARYICDKITGELAESYYRRYDEGTGEVYSLEPEFCQMSRGRGIGKAWIQKYYKDVARRGTVVLRGKEMVAPRYYENILKHLPDDCWDNIEFYRERDRHLHGGDNSPERLAVKEVVLLAKMAQFNRNSF